MQEVKSSRETIARRVRVAMVEQDVTGIELARRLGVKQPYLSRRLTGTVEFRVTELQAIAKALDVPVGRLVPDGAPAPEAVA
jgi:transcriptional regulator with XRE-family HTH domain